MSLSRQVISRTTEQFGTVLVTVGHIDAYSTLISRKYQCSLWVVVISVVLKNI